MPELPAQDPISAVGVPEQAAPEPAGSITDEAPWRDPALWENRELSWVDFNDRVLQLAEDPSQPLLERLKFAAIYTSNLDEFFMIRVAGLHDQVEAGLQDRKRDGLTANEVIDLIAERVRGQEARQAACLDGALRPALEEHGVRIVGWEETTEAQRREVADRFDREIFPVLTPLGVGLGRPFPYISNLSLSLGVLVRDPSGGATGFARIKVPTEVLPRLQPVRSETPGQTAFVLLEDVIAAHLDALFPGMELLQTGVFRVTRDADFEVSDEADDLLEAVEQELRRRRFGEVVRVELGPGTPPELREAVTEALSLEERQVYEQGTMLDLTDLMAVLKLPDMVDLRDEPWSPVTQPRLQGDDGRGDVLGAMRRGDVLVHHPYDSFSSSVERFVEQAVNDPDVLAIKMTVYRTSDDSPLVPALIRATERGKQAVCLVELKARFDERANISWARALEEAGVHVVYGHPSLKTHAKCILVVRREGGGIRHYVHIGTGNYHPKTARLYTDFGLLTCDPDIGHDVADMFNFLTGYARPKGYRKVLVAPAYARRGLVEEIAATIEAHRRGEPTRIRMKMNALVDPACIRALYAASSAGVPIELNIRGICCLRAGVPGVSDTVRVTSVVGRFLEHSRVYAFERGDEQRVLIGSADLMQRNLDKRVELITPVEDPVLRDDLLDAFDRCMADDTNAWDLREDGTWARRTPDPEAPRSVHRELMLSHAARARETAAAEGDAVRD